MFIGSIMVLILASHRFMIDFIVVLQCLFCFIMADCVRGSCLVSTSSGTLSGICGNDTFPVNQYLGVRYADSPTGQNRFAPPIEFRSSSVEQPTMLPPYCPQAGVNNYSEDCLFLNVFVPNSSSGSILKPVMVWIYGGTFVFGGIADPTLNGTHLAVKEDIIVVTFNYRLGILGFYDDPNCSSSPTNFGVRDAILALQWVQKNIKQFGGDANQVTIFGESSGATMVRTLISSPSAKGLFVRAIMQSDPQNFGSNNVTVAKEILGKMIQTNLSCTNIDCMRELSVNDILKAEYTLFSNPLQMVQLGVNYAYPLGPNIDNDIIPMDYALALEDFGTMQNPVDIIIGTVLDEAGPTVSALLPTEVPGAYFYSVIAQFYGQAFADAIQESGSFAQLVASNSPDCRPAIEQLTTEYQFQCPSQYNSLNIVDHRLATVYMYQFVEGIEYISNEGYSFCGGDYVCHEDDLYVTFGTYDPSSINESQLALSKEVQARWAAFARTGSPNTGDYVKWNPILSSDEMNILLLGSEQLVNQLNSTQCEYLGQSNLYYWQSQYPNTFS